MRDSISHNRVSQRLGNNTFKKDDNRASNSTGGENKNKNNNNNNYHNNNNNNRKFNNKSRMARLAGVAVSLLEDPGSNPSVLMFFNEFF
jgi:hypothetical protein